MKWLLIALLIFPSLMAYPPNTPQVEPLPHTVDVLPGMDVTLRVRGTGTLCSAVTEQAQRPEDGPAAPERAGRAPPTSLTPSRPETPLCSRFFYPLRRPITEAQQDEDTCPGHTVSGTRSWVHPRRVQVPLHQKRDPGTGVRTLGRGSRRGSCWVHALGHSLEMVSGLGTRSHILIPHMALLWTERTRPPNASAEALTPSKGGIHVT